MARIGRNSPCPCGSGRKYKYCCRALEEASDRRCDHHGSDMLVETIHATPAELSRLDELEELSNQVVDLVHAGDLDVAEALARNLCERFPDQIDGVERLGLVYEAQGDLNRATDQYRNAAAFAALTPGFDSESIDFYKKKADQLTKKTARLLSAER